MVENAPVTETDKDVENKNLADELAKRLGDQDSSPCDRCDTTICDGCEELPLAFDEQDAIIQQKKIDDAEVKRARAVEMARTYATTLHRLMKDIAKADCPGECDICDLKMTTKVVYIKDGVPEVTWCLWLIAHSIFVKGIKEAADGPD